jgi:hypothetical protein
MNRNIPGRPSKRGTDLSAIFNVAAQALAANQASLNQADTENQNHGDNMVQTFSMIAQAMSSQRGSAPSAQLQHASEYLAQNATSGSGQVYAQGLAQAAQQFQGQKAVTPDNAMLLIQSLLGGDQQTGAQSGADLLGALMGGQQVAPQTSTAGDLLGSLLGGEQSTPQTGGDLMGALAGGQQGQSEGLDLGDLVNAGMAFMNAKQQGQDNLQAALSALMSAGPMAQKPHRQQSGQLVANALLQAISGMAGRK